MLKRLAVLFTLSLPVFSFGQQVCGFTQNAATHWLECAPKGQVCTLKLSDLACLEDHGDPAPISVFHGQKVHWVGDHKHGQGTCTPGASGCPKFHLDRFDAISPTGCGPADTVHSPFPSSLGGKDEVAKDGTVAPDVSYMSCFKHNIVMDDTNKIDPHLIIGDPVQVTKKPKKKSPKPKE